MLRNFFFTSLIIIACQIHGIAQSYGIELISDKKVAIIPFEKHSNLIIIPVWFNKGEILNFIVDTGARYTMLNERRYIPQSKMTIDRHIKLIGSDMTTALSAYLVPQIEMQVSNVFFKNQTIVVLAEDYLQLESVIGVPVHGILGTDIFQRFIVKIDYNRKLLILFERETFTLDEDFVALDMSIKEGKPYLNIPMNIGGDEINPYLLLDTGASLGIMLHPNVSEEIQLPENYVSGSLARGLGGEIEGYMGRIEAVQLSSFKFDNMVAHFQDLSMALDSTYIDEREGIIGGEIFNRFTMIFDFYKKKLYIKPNRTFKRRFDYDRSGLVVLAAGTYLRNFIVQKVLPNSPAAEAGIKPKDEILRIGLQRNPALTLEDITRIFQGKPGKKICMVVRRGDEKIKVQFQLRDLF